jgi:hypothetical protein
MREVEIYRNENTYTAPFGSVELLENGELIVSFREADQRRFLSHIDPTSRACLVRSTDSGYTWSEPSIIYNDDDGIQDPCVRELSDGTIICSFFKFRAGTYDDIPDDYPPGRLTRRGWDSIHAAWTLGSYVVRSHDGGATWEQALVPVVSPLGKAAVTSDPIMELDNGELLIPLYGKRSEDETDIAFVMRSTDRGDTWTDFSVAACDPLLNVAFMESSLVQLFSGKIICMHKGHYIEDPSRGSDSGKAQFLYQSESTDGGRTWTGLHRTDMWGHPPHVIQFTDGRILCAYGYRRPPYGVRACLSHDDGKTWDLENEIVLYTRGGGTDLGYPCSVQLPDGSVFTAWYDGTSGHALLRGAHYRL